ncbi:hypothetical protein IJ768_02590 [Candidatus Saccharibacteria bacterium]|nr:hypothetical protein [Candidatus Saccharibacteria bacterium]
MATGINLNARLEQRTSAKTGQLYWCVSIQLTQDTEKVVFLEPAELELVKLTYSGSSKVKLSSSSSSSEN